MVVKSQVAEMLERADKLFPICIPSYKRWDRKENKTLTRLIEKCDKAVQDNTYVFVREEQYGLYRESFPSVNIVKLPQVNGLASTRQYIVDFVLGELGQPYFMDMDDDIMNLKVVTTDTDGKPKLSLLGEFDTAKVIRLGCLISELAFSDFGCLLGSFRRVRFANHKEFAQTAIMINKGATPRQVMFINAEGLRKAGIRRNMMFDPTGDDVGFVAEIAKVRGNMFNIPFLAYAFIDDAVNSVIRNDDNRRQLAQYEERCIKQYPMRNYMRVPFTFEDGSYKFCDIDFTKYRKVTGAKGKNVPLDYVYKWIMQGGTK